MPALPWTTGPYVADGNAELHVITTMFQVTHYGDIPRFMRWTFKIRKQLAATDGCAGYSLDAHLRRKTFFTLSAWQDRQSMNRFVHCGQHAAMLADMAGRLGRPTFVESSSPPTRLPLDWAAAKLHLAEVRGESQ